MGSIRFWTNTVTALALLSSASLYAQEATVPSPQTTSAAAQVPAPNAQGAAQPAAEGSAVGQEQSKTVLFEGTPVRLRLTKEVSSANAQVGDAVNFDTLEDVRLGDVVVIPKGSHALGKVTTVVPKRRMGRAGKLDMSIEYVRLPLGERLPLSGNSGEKWQRAPGQNDWSDGGDGYHRLACGTLLPPHAREGRHNPIWPGGHCLHGQRL